MALITYNDKSNYQSSSLANEYKVTANDMNEIKTAINNSTTYSTTETIVGTDKNGKPIYRKVIDVGNLPNNSSKQIAHSISNLKAIKDSNIEVSNGTSTFKLPFVSSAGLEYTISYYIDSTNITITTGTDRSAFSGEATIEYTKTTD